MYDMYIAFVIFIYWLLLYILALHGYLVSFMILTICIISVCHCCQGIITFIDLSKDLTLIYWAPFKLLLLLFSISFIHALIFIWSFLFFVYYVIFYAFCSGMKTGPGSCPHSSTEMYTDMYFWHFPRCVVQGVRVVVLDFFPFLIYPLRDASFSSQHC